MESTTGVEEKNKYKIFSRQGLQFYAQEETGLCSRMCCGASAEAKVYFKPMNTPTLDVPPVFMMEKPFMCCCPVLLPYCQKEATFKEANGNVIGFFQLPLFGGCCIPTIDMFDRAGGTKIGQLTGPCCCVGGGCCRTKFTVSTAAGVQVATLERQRIDSLGNTVETLILPMLSPTFAEQCNANHSHLPLPRSRFIMHFNPNVDPHLKANLLGSFIFIDYLFFEDDDLGRCFSFACCGQGLPCSVLTNSRSVNTLLADVCRCSFCILCMACRVVGCLI